MKHVLHVIAGLGQGGAESILSQYISHDRMFHHAVATIADGDHYATQIRDAGASVTRIDVSRLGFRRSLNDLRRLASDLNADVIFGWMYHGMMAASLMQSAVPGARVVWGLHSGGLPIKRSVPLSTLGLLPLLTGLSYASPTTIVSCAQWATARHRRIGWNPQLFVTIPNGVDTKRFQPHSALGKATRQHLGIGDGDFLVGCVARVHPQKDHETLLRGFGHASAKKPNMRLLLVGQGTNEREGHLFNLVRNLGIEHLVIGLGPRQDIPAIMNALDLHVLASAYGEAFPGVICEALACGKPCVATDVGDSARIIGAFGHVVPPSAPNDLAGAICMAYDTRKLFNPAAAVAHVSNAFGFDTMVAGYAEVLSGRLPRRSSK